MTGGFAAGPDVLRAYQAKLRTSVDELREAFRLAGGPDLTELADGSAGEFAESATFVDAYRCAARLLWPEARAALGALDDAAGSIQDTVHNYVAGDEAVAQTLRAIADLLRSEE
ncbi:MAG TPA: hypothetical protein VFW65_11330 [Pseudonocardiaceae bacterium]|nr:hypothetical protein [Pseudonocardiaceae bacterium]